MWPDFSGVGLASGRLTGNGNNLVSVGFTVWFVNLAFTVWLASIIVAGNGNGFVTVGLATIVMATVVMASNGIVFISVDLACVALFNSCYLYDVIYKVKFCFGTYR